MRKRVTEECAANPHLSAGGTRQVQTYYLETRACTQPHFAFFLRAHRARAKKVVRNDVRPPYASATTKSLATAPPPPGAWPA